MTNAMLSGMKTAASILDRVFESAEKPAARLGVAICQAGGLGATFLSEL